MVDGMHARSGRYIGADGNVYNLVDLMGAGATPVGAAGAGDLEEMSPNTGQIIGEDGKIYNIVDLIIAFRASQDAQLTSKAKAADVMHKLISRTIAAGENVAAITWTQDDAGNALALEEAEVRIIVPANALTIGALGFIGLRINGISTGYFGSASDNAVSAELAYVRSLFGMGMMRIKRDGGYYILFADISSSDGTTRTAASRYQAVASGAKITSLYVYAGSGLSAFPAGTSIEISGRA